MTAVFIWVDKTILLWTGVLFSCIFLLDLALETKEREKRLRLFLCLLKAINMLKFFTDI